MKVVIAAKSPAVEMDVSTLNPCFGKLEELSRPFVKSDQLMVFRRILFVIIARPGLDMVKDASVNDGSADELGYERVPLIFSLRETKRPVSIM